MTGKTISSWVGCETAELLDKYAQKIGMTRSDTIRILLERQLRKKKVD
jgi:macrodomain Ter protein organizer (MatP/YcbG family)